VNVLCTYHAGNNQIVNYSIKEEGIIDSMPVDINSFLQTNYEMLCGMPTSVGEIDGEAFKVLSNKLIVDVRNPTENPQLEGEGLHNIPLDELSSHLDYLQAKTVVFVCQSGIRSLQAIKMLKEKYPDAVAYSLKGGIRTLLKDGELMML